MIKRKGFKLLRGLIALLLTITVISVPKSAHALPLNEVGKGPVVIHAVYGGGGNKDAHISHDFIILQNISDTDINLDGWAIQYASATGNFSGNTKALTGSIEAGGYYQILGAVGNNTSLPNPIVPDFEAGFKMQAVNFKVALTSDTTAIAVNSQPSELVATYPNIVDYVGVGNATASLGDPAPAVSNSDMLQRTSYTGDNSKDYKLESATVENLSYLDVSETLNKSGLLAKINEASTKEAAYYTQESFDALQIALLAAQSVYEDESASQEQINDQITALTQALENLVATFVKIDDVRKLPTGQTVKIEGIITGVASDRAWIQDETGAIVLYRPDNLASLAPGNKIRVTGVTAEYNQLKQLAQGATYDLVSSTNSIPAPISATPKQINDSLGSYESYRVYLKEVTLTTINYSGTSILTSADGSTIGIYQIPTLTDTTIAEGDVVTVVGMVDNFRGTAQLKVLNGNDVVKDLGEFDPIDDIEIGTGMTSLKDAQSLTEGSATLLGSVAYKYAGNSILIQDTIEGEIYGFQIYDYPNFDQYQLGDIVKVTGTISPYGGVPQIQQISSLEVVRSDQAYEPQILTIPELLSGKDRYLSEFIKVEKVVLGTYNSDGNTQITDQSGKSINIYKSVALPYGVEAGEEVHVLAGFSKYNTSYQLRVGSSQDYIVIEDTKGPVITDMTLLNPKVGEDYELLNIEVQDNVGVASVTVRLNGGEALELLLDESTGKYNLVIPGYLIVAGEIILTFEATDVNGLKSSLEKTVVASDKPEIKSVKPAPNTATKENKRPEIVVNFMNAGENPIVNLTLNELPAVLMEVEGEQATYTPESDLKDGVIQAGVTITREDGVVGVYTWKFTIGEPLYNFYFGQIHSHTAEYSDGTGTLQQALTYAKNAHQLDFFAVTDHSNYFDSATHVGSFDDSQSGLTSKTNAPDSMWHTYKNQINNFNEDGEFVTFAGFEMTWSGGPGHMNTFNTNGFVSRNHPLLNSRDNSHDDVLTRYYNLLKEQEGSFSMFNHPGNTFGTFNDFAHWDPVVDDRVKLIEVGNGEGLVGSSGYWPSYQYYTQALDKGWHVAPSNGQDNHKGKWGDSNTTRTVVIANQLSRSSIFEAIDDLMVYSTEDDNFEVYYTANDLPMGSTFADEPETIRFSVNMNDPDLGDNISTLEVISSGGIVAYSKTIGTNSSSIEFEIPNNSAYYYLRIVQADGEIIVTAPVWTGSVTMVGIDEVSKDSAMEIINEEFNVTTSLYNYEAEDFEVTSIEYSVNEKVIKEITSDLPIVKSNEKLEVSHPISIPNVGEQYLLVTVTGYLGETELRFNGSLRLNVYDQSQVMKVGVDAFHDNFYVSGDYSGSDSNFIAVAAQSGAAVEHINEVFTVEKLMEYDVIVLTVPYLGFGKGGKAYTEDEISAIVDYAKNGGNLVLTSKSDRGNATNVQNASEVSNQILAAIGAKARVADGIVVDNEKKENESYRLNFTEEKNFAEVNELSYGIFSDTTGVFSAYNAAPILANGATPIIVGYETTWGASYFDDFGGQSAYVPNYETDKVVVPMGQVNVVTTETLSGGGFLVTSGVTFFSTFEVKTEMLQDRDQRTANYRLVQNILNAAKPEVKLSTIAEVHQAEEGKFFSIEGILTSNASGYDTSTAFFDSAYVQDETGGINIFPISGNYQQGQRVRISGTTSSYNGEHQLNIASIEMVDESINEIKPTLMTSEEIKENLGLLVKVEGVIKDVVRKDGVVESILVEDETGQIIVFIDGYIMPSFVMENIVVGNNISAIGLSSISVNDLGDSIQRIRVRNRREILATLPVIVPVVKDQLEDLVKAALMLQLTDYTDDSKPAFIQALEHAQKVLNDSDATQEEVNQAYLALQKAQNNLVRKVDEVETPTEEVETPTDPETDTSELPDTGTDDMKILLFVGIGIVLVGLVLLFLRSREKKQ